MGRTFSAVTLNCPEYPHKHVNLPILLSVSLHRTDPTTAGWYPDPAGGRGQRWHDGVGWTGQTSYAEPMKPLGAPFASLADWLSRLLLTMCALSVVILALDVWSYLHPVVVILPDTEVATGNGLTHLMIVLGVGVLYGLAYCVTGVVWLVWQHRLAVSAPAALKSSPGMHVVWWFVPFAAYWKPIGNMTDLWRSYGSARRDAGPVEGPPFFLWWMSWIVGVWFTSVMFTAVLAGSVEAVRTLSLLAALGALASALSAGLAALVVRTMSWQALLVHTDADRT